MDSEHKKKKKRAKNLFLLFEPLAGLCRSGLFCSLTCCASRFAATNHRSSPKRHERLGGPLTVRSPMDSEHKKKKKRAETLFLLFEPLAGLEPATHALRMRCSTN